MRGYFHPQSIKAARKALGWSQERLGSLCGISRHSVSATENRTRPIKTYAINAFADALNQAGAQLVPLPIVRDYYTFWPSVDPLHAVYRPEPKPKMRCRAKTRSGKPCKRWPEKGKTRCKLHGGSSTGPKTRTGKQAISEAQKKRWQKYREHQLISS